jgi:hypothetical protein
MSFIKTIPAYTAATGPAVAAYRGAAEVAALTWLLLCVAAMREKS